MIDLALLRTAEGIKLVRESEKKRFGSEERVEKLAKLIEERVKVRYELEQVNKERNRLVKEGQAHFKSKEQTAEQKSLAEAMAGLKAAQSSTAARLEALEKETQELARAVGNILDAQVHTSRDEEENPVVFTRERKKKEFAPHELLPFDQILERLDAVDMKRGSKVAGHRGYFLKNNGLILAQGLARYALDFLKRREYTLVQTPYMMTSELMHKTSQLSDFEEQLYKVEGDVPMYLIATSEQPISALHADEWLRDSSLPIRYGGYSTCFRKEAGAHGKDLRGIFRIHQFEKVEQFLITAPEESAQEFAGMVERSKEFYDSLEIGYRVVSIVSGALNSAAAIKYDLEAYFPESGRYRELVSCSNCTDYQSRDLNVRYGFVDSGDAAKRFVHMLNGTLCAVQRTLCCLLENYQAEEGVVVPAVLVPYVGEKFLPYRQ